MDALVELPAVSREQLVQAFREFKSDSRALIVHTNELRQVLNLEVRAAEGRREQQLQEEEPLLILANNYNLDRYNGEVVAFGGWEAPPGEPQAVRDRYKNLAYMMSFGVARIGQAQATLSPEEVFGQAKDMPPSTIKRVARQDAVRRWHYEPKLAPTHLSANLGYCLTCHKAQGSEFKDVAVVVEPSIGGHGGLVSHAGRRWLYTAITRAREHIHLCIL